MVGAVTPTAAWEQVERLWPVIAFLASLLMLGHLCAAEGLFTAAGDAVARIARGSPRRLLVGVFVVASVVTAVLSLDATVVLLTPVVFATAAPQRRAGRPHVYACTHLANSASLLLPVSNLTNLLAFAAIRADLRVVRRADGAAVAGRLAIEYVVLRRLFRSDLAAARAAVAAAGGARRRVRPRGPGSDRGRVRRDVGDRLNRCGPRWWARWCSPSGRSRSAG